MSDLVVAEIAILIAFVFSVLGEWRGLAAIVLILAFFWVAL